MLTSVELSGFKSFGRKAELRFSAPIVGVVGPNGSGKSNVAEALRFVLGEQSMKSLRSKKGEDLIWGGSGTFARANRASVKVTFDNRARRLDLDFDEVVIERVVYRDGQNEYLLNGSQVRLKDVIRLLAGANIGGSGYQIISQGEADRILNASPRERREMVEDALGLKLYQHKKAESERKLEETRENIGKVESLRRELAPHLKFLRKQVERIEKVQEMKDELAHKLAEYLAREHAWISGNEASHHDDAVALERSRAELVARKRDAEVALAEEDRVVAKTDEEEKAEAALSERRRLREEAFRALARAEGVLAALHKTEGPSSIPSSRALDFARVVKRFAEVAMQAGDVSAMREQAVRIREEAEGFLRQIEGDPSGDVERAKAEAEVVRLAKDLAASEESVAAAEEAVRALRLRRDQLKDAARDAERTALTIEAQLKEVEAKLREAAHAKEAVVLARQAFEEEVREGIVLIGEKVHGWEGAMPEGALSEPRVAQEQRRREIERLKIKIEEYGAGNGDDVMKEFTQTHDRDQFLGRELADLAESQQSLANVIEELDATIDAHFSEGLEKINEALGRFFTRLFNGGSASLFLEKPRAADEVLDGEEGGETPVESEVPIAGLSVSVQLPRKKVRGLEVLSGGERALTSIALIFAMSQVNPPPFLILDETDAALDEANSKRYADMITELSRHSQLIVITHNRATMSAAGELYGVTMTSDGVSKLLSVRLEEAERVAK